MAVPLEALGLKDGGVLKDVSAFSAVGTFATGAASPLDQVNIAAGRRGRKARQAGRRDP